MTLLKPKRIAGILAAGLFLACPFLSYAQDLRTETLRVTRSRPHLSIWINLEMPAPGQGQVAAGIREQLIGVLDRRIEQIITDGEEIRLPAFQGNRNDTKALEEYYRTVSLYAVGKAAQERSDYFEDEEWSMTVSWSVEKTWENERVIVFNSEGFLQGTDMMHAADIGDGPLTYDKTDGKLIDVFFKSHYDPYLLRPLLYRGLCEYFSPTEELLSDIDDELRLDDYLIPLPRRNPRPMDNGMVFTYLPMEITDITNQPEFHLSYYELLPFLSSDVLQRILGYRDVTASLSERVLELCPYIPDHGYFEGSEHYMTPELSRAFSEAFAAPTGAYGEIGDNEWLFYFVTGQEGYPVYQVDHVYQIDEEHAIADIKVRIVIEQISNEPMDEVFDHQIEMTLVDGKWLMSDFDHRKEACQDYIRKMRHQYRTGEIIEYLQSQDYTREYIPLFKDELEAFYDKFGGRPASSEKKDYDVTVTSDPAIDGLPAKADGLVPMEEVDRAPSFNGGDMREFTKWVNSVLDYPQEAKENGVQGRVTLRFTVTADGAVEDITVYRGVDPSLDREAVRVVSRSPKWIPATKGGFRVPVSVQFPLIFQLR